jgi:hypothetical protein
VADNDALRAALREAVDLLIELRDCPLTVLEQRQAEIDRVVAETEQAIARELEPIRQTFKLKYGRSLGSA